MTEPFLGEIQIFGFNFPPYQWAVANGQTMPISQNAALFSLLGTNFGGNGQTSFMLPNLISRSPVSQGQGPGLTDRVIGAAFGEADVSLTVSEIPGHSHTFTPSNPPAGATKTLAPKAGSGVTKFAPDLYVPNNPRTNAIFAPTSVGMTGNSLPHSNQQPFLALNMCIALVGAFPTFG